MDLTNGNDLERQLILTKALWKQLRYDHGVRQGTPVRVQAFFYTADAHAAQSLAAKYGRGEWASEVTEVEAGEELRIRILTPRVAFSRRMLEELAEIMIAAGIQTSCCFDGFEVMVPAPPAWWKFWHW